MTRQLDIVAGDVEVASCVHDHSEYLLCGSEARVGTRRYGYFARYDDCAASYPELTVTLSEALHAPFGEQVLPPLRVGRCGRDWLRDDAGEVGDGNIAPDGRDTFGGVEVFRAFHDESRESRS